MKKTRLTLRILILLCLTVTSLLLFVACNGAPKLDMPSDVKVIDNTTLSWTAVTHARGYTVDINGKKIDTRRTTVSLREYVAGKYTIRVKALGDGEKYSDSPWEVLKFEKEYESGMVYQLSEDGK